jgi:phosphatidylserine decarboxylase
MHEVVRELQALVEKNCWWGKFEEAIKNAHRYNIPSIRHIHNLHDYLEWLDNLLKWVPVEDRLGKQIYDQLCEFYFFLDQPPVRELQNRIAPETEGQPLTELSQWMVNFAKALGSFLDTTESVNSDSIESFHNSPSFNMDEYMPPPSGYKTFNQPFARHIKPGMRPVAALSDPCVITCAVDSTFLGWWQLNEQSKITVKGLEWSVLDLLEGSPYRSRFKGGVFMHGFLNVFDYHRLHAPVGGVVKEARVIQGRVYVDVRAVTVDDDDAGERHHLKVSRTLASQDGTGYQFAQTRGLIILDTPIGLVAVLPIGMGQVSSVVMTAEVDKTLRKGEEFAYFQFGGSDHIVLFEAVSNVNLTAQPGAHYNQGACIGYAHPN